MVKMFYKFRENFIPEGNKSDLPDGQGVWVLTQPEVVLLILGKQESIFLQLWLHMSTTKQKNPKLVTWKNIYSYHLYKHNLLSVLYLTALKKKEKSFIQVPDYWVCDTREYCYH